MGCVVSINNTDGIPNPPVSDYDFLCVTAKQKLQKLSHFNTGKSFFYTDRLKRLWKMRKEPNKEELMSTYHNNFRVFLLPETNVLLKPTGVFHVKKGIIAITMPLAMTDMFEMLHENTNFSCITNGLVQISNAITWLHQHGLAHRDIKPENIAYHQGRFKLIDFDFCSPLEDFTHCGTTHFMCTKEMTYKWNCSAVKASKRVDIYAFGKTVLVTIWNASRQKAFAYDKRLLAMFESDYMYDIDVPYPWKNWFKVALTCCCREPPDKIPLLPLAITNTVTTSNGVTKITSVKVVHANPVFT